MYNRHRGLLLALALGTMWTNGCARQEPPGPPVSQQEVGREVVAEQESPAGEEAQPNQTDDTVPLRLTLTVDPNRSKRAAVTLSVTNIGAAPIQWDREWSAGVHWIVSDPNTNVMISPASYEDVEKPDGGEPGERLVAIPPGDTLRRQFDLEGRFRRFESTHSYEGPRNGRSGCRDSRSRCSQPRRSHQALPTAGGLCGAPPCSAQRLSTCRSLLDPDHDFLADGFAFD